MEMLTVTVISSILMSMAVSNIKELNSPLQNGTAQLTSFMREVRAKSIATTLAYTITPSSSTGLVVQFAPSCNSEDLTADPGLSLSLPAGTYFSQTDWSICYTPRGLSDSNTVVALQDGSQAKSVEVMLGGGVRVL